MHPVGGRSMWLDTLPAGQRRDHAPLPGPGAYDVAVVGGGLTGLWTAYSLARIDATLRIVVLERDVVGFGASGRNGGWCSALLPVALPALAARHGRDAAIRMQRAMHDTVAEVAAVCATEGIDADLATGGTIDLVRTGAQLRRARRSIDVARSFGFGEQHLRWLDEREATAHCAATRVAGATYTPHCAAVHPLKLVHGLAAAAVRRGVTIHEHTAVRRLEPGRVETDHGRVTAEVIVRATEGYTSAISRSAGRSSLGSSRREILPLYSMMIATEPLDAATWETIGLADRPTFADGRHTVIYGQRTADGRLAFGGRGAPYHFGSRVDPSFDTDVRVRDALVHTLTELFPSVEGASVTHHWGGPLGMPRDLHPHIRFDRATGFATAGGYVGDGLATTNLAGRTLADLICGTDSELVGLPWVGHRSRRWEPEPLRWLGVNAVRLAAGRADRTEDRNEGRPSRLGALVQSLVGH